VRLERQRITDQAPLRFHGAGVDAVIPSGKSTLAATASPRYEPPPIAAAYRSDTPERA